MSFGEALQEAEQAISRIRAGEDYIDLKAASVSRVRKRQHQLARQARICNPQASATNHVDT